MQSKRILLAVIPEKGHINPMIGIAQHLQEMGFELFFFSQQDISGQLQKAGLHHRVYSAPGTVNINDSFVTRGKEFVEKLADKPWLHNWIRTLLIDAVPAQTDLLMAAAKDCQPDLIVADPMIYAAAIVAARLGIPWVGVSSSLNPVTPDDWSCELTRTLDALREQRNQLFVQQGLAVPRFKVSDALSPWLNLVYSTEEYIPRAVCGNDFSFYIGHSFPLHQRGDESDFPFHRLEPGKKKVYMSMGSQIYYHPHLFKAAAEALKGEDIQLIFAINELCHTPFVQELSPDIITVPYAPQLQLLPHIDLFISHGGANSVMEGLANGIPMALLPICNDQFLQARFITRAGAGILLNPQEISARTYRQQLLPLLEKDAPERKRAAAIGRSFQQHGGAKEGAALILRLHQSRQSLQHTI